MPEEQIENSNLNTTPVAQSNSNDFNTTPFIPNFSTHNHNSTIVDNASANNTNKLVEQLTTQLNIQTANSQQQSTSPQQQQQQQQQQTPHLPMQPLQPTPAPVPVPAHPATNEQLLQQQLQFAQFYQMQSSIFATPQSMPTSPSTSGGASVATPTAAQPFMMPTGTTPLFYPQQYQATYPGGGTTQVMMMPVQIATINGVQQPVMMAIPSSHANMFAASAAGTPLMSAAQMPPTPNTLLASPSSSSVTTAANATGLPLSSGSLVANPNETFEQKWARIQAQKKTNPFAEDIAKKFEIKL